MKDSWSPSDNRAYAIYRAERAGKAATEAMREVARASESATAAFRQLGETFAAFQFGRWVRRELLGKPRNAGKAGGRGRKRATE